MKTQPDINTMAPFGKLGYVDTRLVLTSVSSNSVDAETIINIAVSSGTLAKAGPWEPVEQHNERVEKVTIGEHQGPGWVVTAVFVKAETK